MMIRTLEDIITFVGVELVRYRHLNVRIEEGYGLGRLDLDGDVLRAKGHLR